MDKCVFCSAGCDKRTCVGCGFNPHTQEKRKVCFFNGQVDCEKGNCQRCGWCPTVAERRKAEINARVKYARALLKGGVREKSWVWGYRERITAE